MAQKEEKREYFLIYFLRVPVWVRMLMLFLLNVDGILKNKNRTHIRVFREKKSSILVSATHF